MSASRSTSAEENKALVRRYYEEIANDANIDRATAATDKLLTSNFAFYALNDAEGTRGLDDHKQFLVWHHNVAPDQHFTTEELIAEGDTVASRFTLRGTQHGEFMGQAPTGKPFTVRGMDLFHIEEGKIAELRRFFDVMDMLQQLQASPAQPTL